MNTPPADQVIVSSRHNGPPRSGNGGYVCGLLAHELRADPTTGLAVEVSLRQPPPLDLPLDVRREATADGTSAALTFGGAVVAGSRTVAAEVLAVEPVPYAEALAASERFPGHRFHPFPTCFVCGTERPDGLRIFPGPVPPAADGGTRVAATWTPAADEAANWHEYAESAPRECLAATWASLDCIGGWAGDLGERLMVLGRMTAIVDALPMVGEPHVVMGQSLGTEGRKTNTLSTLYDPDGRIVGRASHVWLAVDPATFNQTAATTNRESSR
ncbi:MAG: hypothetical protein ACR2FG_07725 [Marmoricola sp.]